MLKNCRIRVEGFGEIATPPGLLFLEVLNARDIDLHNDCGGHLKCGKCRIVFSPDPHHAPPEPLPGDRRHLSPEQIDSGTRLACIHQVREDCQIEVPAVAEPELLDDLE